ncbi:MAG TPA: hypothetical protein VI758_05450 [Bacteroidota bacterium]
MRQEPPKASIGYYIISMSRLSRTLTASLLIATFGVFSVGLPIVKYLCPMMSDENPVCAMMHHSNDKSTSLTDQSPSCCGSYIVAERNTTPYHQTANYNAPDLQPAGIVSVLGNAIPDNGVPQNFAFSFSPPPEAVPLYVVNSTLLI